MNDQPTVSVVIPAYNRADSLADAITSVTAQTFRDLEIIVVDDGSTDGTRTVVERLTDDRIRYVRHDVNKGANAARNTGTGEARGRYVAFQDSDDYWHPEKLQKQVDACAATGASRLSGNASQLQQFLCPNQLFLDLTGAVHVSDVIGK